MRRACALTSRPVAVNVLVAPRHPRRSRRGRIRRSPLAPLRRELGLPDAPAPAPPPATPAELIEAGLEAGARVVSVGLGDPSVVRDLAAAAGAPLIAMASRSRTPCAP